MEFRENALTYNEYKDLRASMGWADFGRGASEKALSAGYCVAAFDGEKPVAMGRLITDGLYRLIVDVVVRPEYQRKGLGSRIVKKLAEYRESITPVGGRISLTLLSNPGIEEFYEKQGFKTLPDKNTGSGMRKVIHK